MEFYTDVRLSTKKFDSIIHDYAKTKGDYKKSGLKRSFKVVGEDKFVASFSVVDNNAYGNFHEFHVFGVFGNGEFKILDEKEYKVFQGKPPLKDFCIKHFGESKFSKAPTKHQLLKMMNIFNKKKYDFQNRHIHEFAQFISTMDPEELQDLLEYHKRIREEGITSHLTRILVACKGEVPSSSDLQEISNFAVVYMTQNT